MLQKMAQTVLHMHRMDRGMTFQTPFSMSPATPVAQPSVLGLFRVPCVLYSTCSKAYASLAGQALTQLFSSLTVLLKPLGLVHVFLVHKLINTVLTLSITFACQCRQRGTLFIVASH